ncbi:MAG: hypothetical protein HY010_13655 [Acidobacteria bacterium]|nr:hypothetical protein [Acidobacteriota bacterium]
MNIRKNAALATLILSTFVLFGQASAANPPANAEELIAQHLDSIASGTVRAGLKTRVVQGPVRFSILNGASGSLEGKAAIVSDGKKFQVMMKLQNNDYRGEQFVYDGDKDKVALSTAQKSRSNLGNFVFVQNAVLQEGLLGGALTTSWPLLKIDERKPKLSFGGLKKLDGQELYDLRYRPKKNSDLEIHLYFDPQTYRHVATVYSLSVTQGLAGDTPVASGTGLPNAGSAAGGNFPAGGTAGIPSSTETNQARQQQNRYLLKEKFSEFTTVDGVTLPTHYDIQFTQELQTGSSTLSDWDLKGLDIASNVTVDARNFDVK